MESTKKDEAMKARIEKLIDVYCSFVFGVDRDAGWHAPSQLESLVSASMAKKSGGRAKYLTARVSAGSEHQGNDRADDKMINEMRFVRNKHYDFELAKILLSKIEIKNLLALLAGRYLNQVYHRPHTEPEIAHYLKVSEKTVYNRKKSAEGLLASHMQLIEELQDIRTA